MTERTQIKVDGVWRDVPRVLDDMLGGETPDITPDEHGNPQLRVIRQVGDEARVMGVIGLEASVGVGE